MEVNATKSSFRQYIPFWGGQMFSLLGSMVVQFVIFWYLTETTENNCNINFTICCWIY
ncbi:MAG: hypothetical protein P8Y23_01320 [Candidatus Lokiarchaeota archaeon]